MQRVAQVRLMHTAGVVLWTTTAVLLKEHGPLAPIWLQSVPLRSLTAQPDHTLRWRLSQVVIGMKDR